MRNAGKVGYCLSQQGHKFTSGGLAGAQRKGRGQLDRERAMTEIPTAEESQSHRVVAGLAVWALLAAALTGCGKQLAYSSAPSDAEMICCASEMQQASTTPSPLPAEQPVGSPLDQQTAMTDSDIAEAATEIYASDHESTSSRPHELANRGLTKLPLAGAEEPSADLYAPGGAPSVETTETNPSTGRLPELLGPTVSSSMNLAAADPQIPAPHWQTAIHDPECQDCKAIGTMNTGKPYRIRISLDEKQEGTGTASTSTASILRRLKVNETYQFKLVPIYVNGIAPLIGTDPKPVDLVARWPQDGSTNWGEATLDIRVLPEARRCAQMIVSVWDFDMRVAHDAFMVTFPLPGFRNGVSNCRNPLQPDERLDGPKLLSVSDVFKPDVPQPAVPTGNRISLYAFQLPIPTGDSYAFVALAPAGSETTVRGWKLMSPLKTSFGSGSAFSNKALRDRNKMRSAEPGDWIYKETARFIREGLFLGVGVAGRLDGQDAFKEIQSFVNDKEEVDFFAQLYVPITIEEQGMMFLPLRTMTASNSVFFKKDFRLLSPLPSTPDEGECISDWKVILDGDMASSDVFNSLKKLKQKPWRDVSLHTYEDILAYFDPESVSPMAEKAAFNRAQEPGGIGLIIAAHYGGGKLGLDKEDLPINQLKRPFPRGSAAILAACETAAPSEAGGIINQLRDRQVDAFLASPLKVPTPYALSMVNYLTKRIDEAYENGATPTLRELYSSAMDDVGKEDPTNLEINNLGREYVMVGNLERRLCKRPLQQETEQWSF
jgi:hypothetical protein